MSKLFQATRILVLSIAGASLACATKIDDQPSQYKGPLQPVGIYASDTGGDGLPDFAVWSAGPLPSGNNVVGGGGAPGDTNAAVPPTFNQLRVEFNQTLNPATVANNLNILGTKLRYSYCTPTGSGTNKSVQLIAVEAGGPRSIDSSVCYDPSSGIGGNPKIVIIPGAGTLATGGVTPSPLTCNSFTPTSGESFVTTPSTTYQIKIAPTVTSAGGSAFQSPSGNGWDGAGTYTFKPDTFELLEVGYQNQTTGFNYYMEKLKGFQSGVPATPGPQQIDCDFGSTNATQQPCRIPPDTTPIVIVANAPFDPTTTTNITLTRADATKTPVDAVIAGSAGSRIITVNTGSRWEPNTTYLLTIGTGVKAADGTPLPGTPKTYTFTAGSGLTAGSTNSVVQVVSVVPDKGSTANPLSTSEVDLAYSYPVAGTVGGTPTGSTITVKDPSGAVVSGPATIAAGTDSQTVVVPIIKPLVTGTVYTVSATGVTVGPNVPTSGQSFGTYTSTFRTQDFNVSGIFDKSGTELDGTKAVPPETLVSGDLNAIFVNPVAPATVTPTSLTVNENGALLPTTQAASAGNTTYTLTASDPSFTLKFGTTYQVVASTSITDTAQHTLRTEGCTTGDCTQTLGFTTLPFKGKIKAKSDGSFTVSFPYPINPLTSAQLSSTSMFALYPETLSVDPASGAHTRTADFSKPIAETCTLNGTNTKISCTPNTPVAAGAYYLASATFYKAGSSAGVPATVASPLMVGGKAYNFDATSGTFFGTLQAEILSAGCPP